MSTLPSLVSSLLALFSNFCPYNTLLIQIFFSPKRTVAVGKALLNQLSGLNRASAEVGYNVVLIAPSSSSPGVQERSIVTKNFAPINLQSWNVSEDVGTNPHHLTRAITSTGDVAEFLERSKRPVILVDTTGALDNQEPGAENELVLAQSYPLLADQGISIVSANKTPFALESGLWNSIFRRPTRGTAKRGLVQFSATVGSGLPVTGILQDMMQTGDTVRSIQGVLTSPLSYIFNQYSQPGFASGDGSAKNETPRPSFSQVVREAVATGYVPNDPRLILSGLQAAQQFTILTRTVGLKVENSHSFAVRNLTPKPLREAETVADLLEKLPKYDSVLEKLRTKAEKENKVIRYVGTAKLGVDNSSLEVGIESFDVNHPFARLKNDEICLSVTSDRYTEPIVIKGPGSNPEASASRILSDIFKLSQKL